MYESRKISIHQHLRNIKDKSEIHECIYESQANIVRVGCKLFQQNEIEDNTKNQEQSAKSFPSKSKTLKQKNIAKKKSIVSFTTNSKATVKLTLIPVTDAQLTKA